MLLIFRMTSVALIAAPFFLVPCQAMTGGGSTESPATWSALPSSVNSARLEDVDDFASFMLAGTELASTGTSKGTQGAKTSATAVSPAMAPGQILSEPEEELPSLSDMEESIWETNFDAGVLASKQVVDADDSNVGGWVFDSAKSGAVVPSQMLQSELLLQSSADSPAGKWKAKTAEHALRLYYHSKWLAERNYMRAAEYRYRESAQLARSCRRSVLASHSLARLGYFLVHWGRHDEAKSVLSESLKLNMKSNPLARYLHGVIERKAVSGDVEHLRIAEDHILNSGEQPSEELELERSQLIGQINYWREAEESSVHCFTGSDVAHVMICLCGHAVAQLQQFLK